MELKKQKYLLFWIKTLEEISHAQIFACDDERNT